jgi:hypothetical protein
MRSNDWIWEARVRIFSYSLHLESRVSNNLNNPPLLNPDTEGQLNQLRMP